MCGAENLLVFGFEWNEAGYFSAFWGLCLSFQTNVPNLLSKPLLTVMPNVFSRDNCFSTGTVAGSNLLLTFFFFIILWTNEAMGTGRALAFPMPMAITHHLRLHLPRVFAVPLG